MFDKGYKNEGNLVFIPPASFALLNFMCVKLIMSQLITSVDTTSDIKISRALSGIILLTIIQIAANRLDTRIALIGTEFLLSLDKNAGAFPCSAKP